MYNVVVVDDEPSAIRNISMIIEKYCEKFQVVATAENGEDAIEKISNCYCDVVITDVCMPILDGIRLIEWINKQNSDTKTLVTSGYQEFDHVQKAINLGACSYLVKPVIPAKMRETLSKVESYLDKYYITNQIKLFNAFYFNERFDMAIAKKFFTSDEYYLAVKRQNGLPARYKKNEMFDVFAERNSSIIICGRDINEELFFIPSKIITKLDIEHLVKVQSSLNDGDGYFTLVYFDYSMKINDFPNRVKELYRALDSVIATGMNQVLTTDQTRDIIKKQVLSFESDDLDKLYYFIKEQQNADLKKEIEILFKSWEKKRRTHLYIEATAKQILFRMRQTYGNNVSLLECEYLIEEMFVYSRSVQELRENFIEILKRFFKQESYTDRIDTPHFLDRITEYLKLHIDKQISLKQLCKVFGVSQPYLSKMFRKYLNESYNQYVTRIKVEKAKTLMMQRDSMKIKDVAALVGYDDQFYFSRVFRSCTGNAPSEFISSLKEQGGRAEILGS